MSRTLWLLFAIFIVYGTTIPFDFTSDRARVVAKLEAVPLNPFLRPTGRRISIPDAVQNVMLFLPFGALGAMACRAVVSSRAALVALVTLLAATLSALVEGLQLLTADRVTSLSDVISNTMGGGLGALATVKSRGWWLDFLQEYGTTRALASRWTYPALIALATLGIAAWQPFDLTIDVRGVGHNVLVLLREPWQAGRLTDEGNAVVLYALAVMAAAAWLRDIGASRPLLTAAGACALLAVGLELSQVFVDSRTAAGSDATVRLLGVLVGWLLIPLVSRARHAFPWLALLLAMTVVSAAISILSPFVVAASPRPLRLFPFLGYYNANWFPIVSHVFELMLIYFPFGFCLGMVRRGRPSVALAVAIAVAVAMLVEYLQTWIVGRYGDVTDVACSALGAALGAWFAVTGSAHFDRARAAALIVEPDRR